MQQAQDFSHNRPLGRTRVARSGTIPYAAPMNEASSIAAAAAAPLHEPRAATPAHKIGVLLLNLGTPEAPDAASVRRYLKEFLSAPRVIENQGPIWKLVLNGIILPVRPRRKVHDYEKIWSREKNESPLKTIT